MFDKMCPYKVTLCQERSGCSNCQIWLDWHEQIAKEAEDEYGKSRVHCSECGKPVSNDVGVEVIVRAYVSCPECLEKERGMLVYNEWKPGDYKATRWQKTIIWCCEKLTRMKVIALYRRR